TEFAGRNRRCSHSSFLARALPRRESTIQERSAIAQTDVIQREDGASGGWNSTISSEIHNDPTAVGDTERGKVSPKIAGIRQVVHVDLIATGDIRISDMACSRDVLHVVFLLAPDV